MLLHMTGVEEQGQLEKQKAEQIIANTPLFDGIESITVELGDDHTGDPSMWLVFSMQHDQKADKTWLMSLNEYSNKLGLKIIDSGITRFPYPRLRRVA
jgi:hypothetical protein